MGKTRDSKYEMLRILMMVMIISHHYIIHGVMHFSNDAYKLWQEGSQVNKIVSVFPAMGGKVGVAIFFMLAGFFLIESFNTSYSTYKKLYSTALFYGVVTVVLFLISIIFEGNGISVVSIKECIKSIFLPISSNVWPFLTAYILLVFSKDKINEILKKLNKKQYIIILCGFIVMWTVISEFTGVVFDYFLRGFVFYSLGAYIRIFSPKIKISKALLGSIVASMLFSISEYVGIIRFDEGNAKAEIILKMCSAFQSMITPLIAFCIFCIFVESKSFNNKNINRIASATFGIYLMHDSILMRDMIWQWLRVDDQFKSDLFPIFAILTIAFLFVVCFFIDCIRSKAYDPIFDIIYHKVIVFFNNLGDQDNGR